MASSATRATRLSDFSDTTLHDLNGRHLTSGELEVASHIREILRLVGEDPEREGLADTPARVAKAYTELFSGYSQDPGDLFRTFEAESYDSMIILKEVPFTSHCEHHIAPFHGVAHVGYVPNARIVGLSKIARLVDLYARRLQVQERMTVQIADAMMDYLRPLGAMVVLEAEHTCISMRGIKTPGSKTVTSAIRGVYLDPEKEAREEFLKLIGKGG